MTLAEVIEAAMALTPEERSRVADVLSDVDETDTTAISRLPGYARQAINYYSAPEHRDALKERWESAVRALLESAQPGSDPQLAFARSFASAARSAEGLDLIAGLLDGSVTLTGLDIDADLRWTLLTGLAAAGRADEDRINEELARDNTISGPEHAAIRSRSTSSVWKNLNRLHVASTVSIKPSPSRLAARCA